MLFLAYTGDVYSNNYYVWIENGFSLRVSEKVQTATCSSVILTHLLCIMIAIDNCLVYVFTHWKREKSFWWDILHILMLLAEFNKYVCLWLYHINDQSMSNTILYAMGEIICQACHLLLTMKFHPFILIYFMMFSWWIYRVSVWIFVSVQPTKSVSILLTHKNISHIRLNFQL